MQPNSLSHQACSITESNDGSEFSFVTDRGIRYIAYFSEAEGYAPLASFAHNVRMFGFGPVKATRPAGKLPQDTQVETVVFEILYHYLSLHPDTVLIYVYSDESIWKPGSRHPRYAKWRSEIFSKWYDEWQQTGAMAAIKIDYALYDQLYCSCLFRSGHPKEQEIRQVIDDTILEKQPPA